MATDNQYKDNQQRDEAKLELCRIIAEGLEDVQNGREPIAKAMKEIEDSTKK